MQALGRRAQPGFDQLNGLAVLGQVIPLALKMALRLPPLAIKRVEAVLSC
jgi:hypothetical protein